MRPGVADQAPAPRPRHLACCGQKEQFQTEAEAQDRLDHWVGYKDPTVQVYKCSCCRGYHLGRYADLTRLAAYKNALRVG